MGLRLRFGSSDTANIDAWGYAGTRINPNLFVRYKQRLTNAQILINGAPIIYSSGRIFIVSLFGHMFIYSLLIGVTLSAERINAGATVGAW